MRRIVMLSILLLAWALAGSVDGLSFATQTKPLDQDSSGVPLKSQKISAIASEKIVAPKVTKALRPSTKEPKGAVLRRPPFTANSHRAIKAHKKALPKAVVQPRTDLMHYGMLENAQRYDPLPHAHHKGVPNPQTSDLTHDHFQELDRNQDGAIDPVERTFGRIDMDRDLHTRTLQ
jgi:hypothetical protein